MTHNNTLHDLHRLNQHHQAKISNILIILRRNNQQQLLLAYLIVSFSLDLLNCDEFNHMELYIIC